MVWNRLKFPNMMVTLMNKGKAHAKLKENQHIFRVSPKYTKHDIKEYLTKIYQLPVIAVTTTNYIGKINASIIMKILDMK